MKQSLERPISFLGNVITASWLEERSCVLTKPTYDFDSVTHTGAVYSRRGALIIESLRPAQLGHWRHVDPVSISQNDLFDATSMLDTAIYGGHFFPMWGHFLFETLTTAAVAQRLPSWPVVFTPFAPRGNRDVFMARWENFKPLLSAAGWGERPLILQESAMRFNRLIIPERLAVFGTSIGKCGIAPEAGDIYRTLRRNIARPSGSFGPMVARRPTWAARRHPVEEEVYDILSQHGFNIIDGATLSPITQVETFANANLLVGFAGSNLHNSVLCPETISVLEIGDRRSYNGGVNRLNSTQVSMTSLLGQSLKFVDSFVDINGADTTQDDTLQPLQASEIAEKILKFM